MLVAADCVAILNRIEAQDIAHSGWNYTGFNQVLLTLFLVLKVVLLKIFMDFYRAQDGTKQHNAFETGSLTADTWTKVTKTFTG